MERKLYLPREVASYNRVKEGTLAVWRCRGVGPGYIKLNGTGAVRYLELSSVNEITEKTIQK
jgi:hypothetical protein